MNMNKRSSYEKFNNFSDLLTEDSVIYVHADSPENCFKKLDTLFKFCNKKKITPKDVCFDIGRTKDLVDKPNLAKIFRDYENIDIITYNSTDITPFGYEDYYDIKRYLKDSNLGIYDLTYENYSFERAPMLVWLGN